MSEVKWQGVYPALTTKFTKDDKLDMETFGENLEVQLEAGVAGIVLGGTLGEASSLANDEKLILLDYAINRNNHRVPVIVNIAEQTTKDAISLTRTLEEKGADGLMLLPPMRYAADSRETLAYFKAIASKTRLPIMIYNNPVDYKIPVTIDMFEALADLPNVQAIKESSRDISYLTVLKNRFGSRYKILSGVDTLALESLMMGADGWVAGLVCAFPMETVAIYNLVQAQRYEEARDIYRWFMPVLALDIHPKLVQYIKLAETMTGLGTEMVRAPRLILEGKEREEIQAIIQEVLDSRPVLPDYNNH